MAQFAALRATRCSPILPIRDATSFTHAGDARSSWTETIHGPGIDMALTWSELGKPFLVDYKPEHSATGKHYMASLFIPGQRAEVVNGIRGVGKPIPRDMYGTEKHHGIPGLLRNVGAWIRGRGRAGMDHRRGARERQARMKATALHSWQVSTHEAIAIQKRLRLRIITENMLGELRYIAGADIATSKDSPKAYAGVVVLSYPTLEVVEERGLEDEVTFPYIPGLLAFREGPLLLKVFEQLTTEPDVLVFDGQGLAHPAAWVSPLTWGWCSKSPASDAPNRCCSAAIRSQTMRRVRGPTCATHRAKSSGRCCARDLRPHRSLCRLAIDWTSPPRFASSWRVRGGTHSGTDAAGA